MKELRDYIERGFPKSMSYEEYREMSVQYAEEGKTSGEDQSQSLIEYSRLNAHRMKRIDKTTDIGSDLKEVLANQSEKQHWILFTETWCGDAAQNLPVVAKIAELSEKVDLRILLRDEHPDLMDHFLTNGGKSIPKLVIANEDGLVQGTWGPRPKVAQEMVMDWKHSPEPKKPYSEFVIELQKWYTKDKTLSTQAELLQLVKDSQESEVKA
ncbi:MAG: thioredoxin family protein [Flavobacteriales bacterium]|nr:thioredoxin family protein [Flavobacteriales bacterium]